MWFGTADRLGLTVHQDSRHVRSSVRHADPFRIGQGSAVYPAGWLWRGMAAAWGPRTPASRLIRPRLPRSAGVRRAVATRSRPHTRLRRRKCGGQLLAWTAPAAATPELSEKSTPWTRAPPVQPSVQAALFANGQDSRSIHVRVHGSGSRDFRTCHASLGLNLLRSTPEGPMTRGGNP